MNLLVSKKTKDLIESKYKKSWQQKLKDQNSDLIQDIFNILRQPESMKGMDAKMKWNVKFDLEEQIWMGSPTK